MRRKRWIGLAVGALLCCSVVRAETISSARPVAELGVNSATLIRNSEPVQFTPARDRFGPGQDSVDLNGRTAPPTVTSNGLGFANCGLTASRST